MNNRTATETKACKGCREMTAGVWCETCTKQPIHKGFSRKQLRLAFDSVCDATNWKMPILASFLGMTEGKRKRIEAAVEFFAGSPVTVSVKGDRFVVEGPGYYACIGA